jgi:hypothetical protein
MLFFEQSEEFTEQDLLGAETCFACSTKWPDSGAAELGKLAAVPINLPSRPPSLPAANGVTKSHDKALKFVVIELVQTIIPAH